MSYLRPAVGLLSVSPWSTERPLLPLLCLASAITWPASGYTQVVQNVVQDSSFESPSLAANSFVTRPAGTPWTFTGSSGIINNSTGWQSAGVPADTGAQVGYLQSQHPSTGVPVGAVSQAIDLLTSPYMLRYAVAGRSGPSGEGGNLPFDVYLDGTLIGSDMSAT